MTKRLILIRHAKSSWDAPFDDHARTLNDKGRGAATAMGAWLGGQGLVPDTIYCSDAARTRETLDLLTGQIGGAAKVFLKSDLYHAPPAALMRTLRAATGDTIAIIAHNLGIAIFAEEIVAQAPDHPRFFEYPTCATLICDLPINDWAEAIPRSGQVFDFVIPKDL